MPDGVAFARLPVESNMMIRRTVEELSCIYRKAGTRDQSH
jgi:hypothetical protein